MLGGALEQESNKTKGGEGGGEEFSRGLGHI